jgi:FkbM family methyltransferase
MATRNTAHIPLLHRLPITLIRLGIARWLYRVLKIFLRDDNHLVRRHGVNYLVDISEGIDLSIFLFGSFQTHIFAKDFFALKPDSIVFDVGANMGSMTFRFAQLVPQGKVYAFEPTTYAFGKLSRNLSLNDDLARRIIPVQTFLSSRSAKAHRLVAYSSWKVDKRPPDAHRLHGGTFKPADDVPTTTIDDFCRDNKIQRVDLIKIDTDGHELEVLQGARETLSKNRPFIIFEIGLYILKERGVSFEEYYNYLAPLGYTLINSKSGMVVTLDNFAQEIPFSFTIDIFATTTGNKAKRLLEAVL